MTKEDIINNVKVRLGLLKVDENHPDVDLISAKIIAEFKKNFNKYEVDFIVETLTMFGQAPNIIYDDNGYFAVSGDGYQPVVYGRKKIEGSVQVFVEKKQWKKTIRLALKHYLFAD